MKRILSLLLTAIVFLSLTVQSYRADDAAPITLRVADVSAHAGDRQVAVDVYIEGNSGISGFSFCVGHDDDLVFAGAEIAVSGYQVIKEVPGYGVNLAWTGNAEYTGSERVATLYFDVDENASPAVSSVSIVFRDGYDSLYRTQNGREEDVPVLSFDGSFTIAADEEDECLTAAAGRVNACAGDTDVVVPVSVTHNSGFSGFSFCVNYDTDRLELISAEIMLSGGYRVVSYPSGYGAAVAWTSDTDCAEDGEIVRLHFSVPDHAAAGEAAIQIVFRSGYDSFYKTVNKKEVDLPCVIRDGCVNLIPPLVGDADGDGTISILDATAIQRYLAGLEVKHPARIATCGDINKNGVDILDATYIQRFLAAFTVPYPIGEPAS